MLEKIKAQLIESNALNWATDKKISFIIEAVTRQQPSKNRLELTAFLAKFLLEEEPDFSEESEIFYLLSLASRID